MSLTAVSNSVPEQGDGDSPPSVDKLTLGELTQGLAGIERLVDMPDEAFDPAVIVGNLKITPEMTLDVVTAMRAKVDSIHFVHSEFEAYAARTKMRAERLMKRAKTAQRRADWLLSYIQQCMEVEGFEQLPGNEFVVKRVRASNPMAPIFEREAEAGDMLEFGEVFVTEIPTSYAWNEKAIKDELKPFYKALKDLPTCNLCEGSKVVVSGHDLMPCAVCCATGKRLPSNLEVPVSHTIARLEWSYSVEFDEADRPDVADRKPRGKKK